MHKGTIKTAVADFMSRTSRITITIIAILVILTVSALVVLLAQPKSKAQTKTVVEPSIVTDFKTEDDFIPPEGIKLTEDYYFSRVTNDTWSREEVDRWFTLPNEAALDELGRANDALVEEIVGAAP